MVATAGNQSRCTLIFFEMFSSPEEHKFHLEQNHMKRMLSALEGKLAEAPIMTKLNALQRSTPSRALGLESVKDADGNLIREAPLSLRANFRQRALDLAIGEINKKTDLNILSLNRSNEQNIGG